MLFRPKPRKILWGLTAVLACIAITIAWMAVASRRNAAHVSIARPSSLSICMDGCKEHQNRIQFYLASGRYQEDSLTLKTPIRYAKILTYGISSTDCRRQDRPGYTCVDMELSHHLLSILIDLHLVPLRQLRNPANWRLEYDVRSHA